jgi:hypothetical protein
MVLVFASVYLLSCNKSSMRIMATWVDKERTDTMKGKKNKIFIWVMTQNYEVQSNLENNLAKAAEAKGVPVVKSLDAFGPILTNDKLPSREAVLKSIRNLGCRGLFIVALVDEHSETHYVEASSGPMYTPYPGYGYGYAGYYSYSVPLYSPGYYSTEKTYFVESNLFDVNTEKMLISMQSKVENPPAIEKSGKKYTEMLVKELQARGFLNQ